MVDKYILLHIVCVIFMYMEEIKNQSIITILRSIFVCSWLIDVPSHDWISNVIYFGRFVFCGLRWEKRAEVAMKNGQSRDTDKQQMTQDENKQNQKIQHNTENGKMCNTDPIEKPEVKPGAI